VNNSDLLLCKGLSRRSRRDERWLLSDIALTIQRGQRIAIVGRSGAGKSLLLRALARLDPIDRGELLWHGMPVVGHRVPEYRRHVIYLHQRPVLADGIVEDSLRQPFDLKAHRGQKFDRECIVEWLELLGRDHRLLTLQQRDLSGGEAQIVALLRAIQLEPEVLLLDEPTAALDAEATLLVERLLQLWMDRHRAGGSTIWVSHDAQQAARVSDHVIKMDQGRLSGD
jgi:putative ABC transport system ATP-binding protein